ncbi:uncharacterized protein [Panulirus ornatus]|uniref:uncharacterized protein isoform X2 n=1 Tax=Panulirus ornatus TaxID=150431 RepID=UPI003A83F294
MARGRTITWKLKCIKTYHRVRITCCRKIRAEVRIYQDMASLMFSDIESLKDKYDLEDSMHHENPQAKGNLTEADTVQESDMESTNKSDNQKASHEKNADEYESKMGVEEMHVKADDDKEQSIKDNDCNEHLETEVKVKLEKGIDGLNHGDAPNKFLQLFPVLKKIYKMFSEELLNLKVQHNKLESDTHKLFCILKDTEILIEKLNTEKYDMNNIFEASCKILTDVCNIDHIGDFLNDICGNVCAVINEFSPSPMLYTTYEYDSDFGTDTDTDSDTDIDTDSDSDSDIDITVGISNDDGINLIIKPSNKMRFIFDRVLTPLKIFRKRPSSYLELYDEVIMAMDISSTQGKV